MAPSFMHASSLSRLARWSCLPLLALITFLLLALHNARQETSRLRQADADASARLAGLQKRITETTTKAGLPKPGDSGQKSADTKKKPAINSNFSDRNAIADPEFGPPVLRRQRRYAMANYRKAIDALGLPPSEKARLKELEAQKWIALQDLRDIQDRATDEDAKDRAYKQVKADFDREILGLLGEDAFSRYEKLKNERTEKAINWATEVAFWDAGLALTSSQQSDLARARADAQALTKRPDYNKERDPLTGLSAKEQALLSSAAAFLSPAQLDLLRTEEQNGARYEMLGELISAKGGSAPTSP